MTVKLTRLQICVLRYCAGQAPSPYDVVSDNLRWPTSTFEALRSRGLIQGRKATAAGLAVLDEIKAAQS